MTDLAILREACSLVIGIIGAVVVAPMTRPAVGRSAFESIAMTFLTVEGPMSSGQREELIVVDFGTFPRAGGVAPLTIRGESRLRVIRIVRILII